MALPVRRIALVAGFLLAVSGCAAPAPPVQDTSTTTASSPSATIAPTMSAAPPSLPSPASASAALPSPPAPAVDRQTCRPTPPAVSFEVEEDDRVVPLDAVGCPLGESHFKFNGYSYKASVELMTDIQGRLKAGDSAGLADLVNYPLHVNHPKAPGQIVKDRAAFIRGYAQIFSPAAVSAILAFDPRDVSCNYQGVMLGNGIVWVAQTTKGHQGIITLNSP